MVRRKAIVVVFLFTVSLISIARASTDSKKTQTGKSNDEDVEEETNLGNRSKKIADNLVNRMAAEMSQMNDGKK